MSGQHRAFPINKRSEMESILCGLSTMNSSKTVRVVSWDKNMKVLCDL